MKPFIPSAHKIVKEKVFVARIYRSSSQRRTRNLSPTHKKCTNMKIFEIILYIFTYHVAYIFSLC